MGARVCVYLIVWVYLGVVASSSCPQGEEEEEALPLSSGHLSSRRPTDMIRGRVRGKRVC